MLTDNNNSKGDPQAASAADRDDQAITATPSKYNPVPQDIPSVLLTQLEADALASVSHITASSDDVNQLKAMGVCAGRKLQIIQPGDPMILRVLGTRLGVSSRLAHTIWVHRLDCVRRSSEKSQGELP